MPFTPEPERTPFDNWSLCQNMLLIIGGRAPGPGTEAKAVAAFVSRAAAMAAALWRLES